MGWGSGCGVKHLTRHLTLLRETGYKGIDLFALFSISSKTELNYVDYILNLHFILGKMTREEHQVPTSE